MLNHPSSSVCGYDGDARQKVYQRQRLAKSRDPQATGTPWERHAPYDFHGCLAHADITYVGSTGEIKRVIGVLEHTELCMKAKLTRLPAIPIHPHVIEVALAQLAQGSRRAFFMSLLILRYS